MTTLIYIADPMCSWCYGFGPELSTLLSGLPDIKLEIVAGGLRAYHSEILNQEEIKTLESYWQRIQEVSGLPFNPRILATEGLIYNTEPACRAIVATRQLAPEHTFKVFQALQQAFYAQEMNITQEETLSKIASETLTNAGFPIDASTFHTTWSGEEAIVATHADFMQTKQWGISGFPTLVLEHNDELHLVTSGYLKIEALIEKMQSIIDQQDQDKQKIAS